MSPYARNEADEEEDKLLMRFTLLDPSDPDREFSIVMDISKSEYQSMSEHCAYPLYAAKG